jgi:hypothetical protein
MSFSFVAFVLIRHHRTGSQTVISEMPRFAQA